MNNIGYTTVPAPLTKSVTTAIIPKKGVHRYVGLPRRTACYSIANFNFNLTLLLLILILIHY